MPTVTSADGTPIAYERLGHGGPALVLVGGAADDGAENAPLAAQLASTFTVLNYARRGRGASGDATSYSVAREMEDLDAVIGAAGGRAHVYGASSGGALALESAAAGSPIDGLVVYEVPYEVAPDAPERHLRYRAELEGLLSEGRRGDAFALAMRTWGASEEMVQGARTSPMWARLKTLAPTLAYDAQVLGDSHPPVDRLARIIQPTTVLVGERSAQQGAGAPADDFFASAATAVADAIPEATRRAVPAQGHVVDAATFAPVIADCLDPEPSR